MLKQERRRRRCIQSPSGSITNGHSQAGERSTYSGPHLPEDIWCLIHCLMPLRDSARSACVSGTFLRSWTCCPILTFNEETLGLKQKEGQKSDIAKAFSSRVDRILKNHIGTGVKIFNLVVHDYYKINASHLNRWLEKAITLGIEEVNLLLSYKYRPSFPCSIFLDGRGNSTRYLHLSFCIFRPTVGFNCLKSLTKVHLYEVCTTGDELGCLISNSFALELLELVCCQELICLKIPFWLEQFSYLDVCECNKLQVIENTAPNLSTLDFHGKPVQLVLGESSQVKNLKVEYPCEPNAVNYAITKLPSIAPHLETLTVYSTYERVNAPMVAGKFLHLKHLDIYIGDDEAGAIVYDYLSLISFMDASSALECFVLSVDQDDMKHDSVFEATSTIRQIPRHRHDRLKKVQVNDFSSAKSMFELTCYIIETATSLESLTLDCIYGAMGAGSGTVRCTGSRSGKCLRKIKRMVLEAHKALHVVNRYIVGRIPSTVKLDVGEPCSKCHAIDAELL